MLPSAVEVICGVADSGYLAGMQFFSPARHIIAAPANWSAVAVLLSGLLAVSCASPAPKSPSLDETIATVLTAFQQQDAATLNQLIDTAMKLTVVYRPGTMDALETLPAIDFTHPVPSYLPYPQVPQATPLQFTSLPQYRCESGDWDKQGLFCDTTQRNHLLSTTAAFRVEFGDETFSPETLQAYRDREMHSHRVVFVAPDGNALVFHLTQHQGRWYLTLLDRVADDCSA